MKQCWEKWESPHMEKTSLVVKLTDGTTMRPVGVVKDLKVKTFGITYHVWLVVKDFKNPIDSYDIILGRLFLRTVGVVHDWSSCWKWGERAAMKQGRQVHKCGQSRVLLFHS